MVDLETLDTSPRATILTLGAVQFDPYKTGIIDQLYLKFDLESQDTLKRTVNQNTINWWQKQDLEIVEAAFDESNRLDIKDAINKFHKFAWGCETFWSHGAVFDLMILEDVYRQLNKTPPWNFWQLRCSRTLFNLGFNPDMKKEGLHNALQDAIRQAVGVQNVYAKLKNRAD